MTNVGKSAVAAGAVSGLLFGFDTAVIAGAIGALRLTFDLSPSEVGMAVSAALWGTLVGALTAGVPGDRLGSRTVLLWVAVLYAVSAIGSAFSTGLTTFIAFRFVGGLAIGGSSVLAPVYLAEISPPERRGRLVGLFQLNIVAGILLAYFSNYIVSSLASGDDGWRVKVGIALFPAIILWLSLLRIPHSPRWLQSKGRHDDAAQASKLLGLQGFGDHSPATPEARSGSASLSWRQHRKPILLALAIATFNQFSGINAILYYSNDIFEAAGFTAMSADLQSVAIGAANLAATLVGLTLIDRLGRKPLLLIGAAGTSLALAGVALIYSTGAGETFLLPLLIVFIAFFAVSQGAVIWVYLSELFPTDVRARGQSLGSATHWLLNASISYAFPVIASSSLAAPFWAFAAAGLVQLLVVWRFFPETKGLELEAVDLALDTSR